MKGGISVVPSDAREMDNKETQNPVTAEADTSFRPCYSCSLRCTSTPKYTMTQKLCIQIALLICWESDLVRTHEDEEIYTPWPPLCEDVRTRAETCMFFISRSDLPLQTEGAQGGLLGRLCRCGLGDDTWQGANVGAEVVLTLQKPGALAADRGGSLQLGQRPSWD